MTDKTSQMNAQNTVSQDERAIALRTLETMIPQALPNVEGLEMSALYRPSPGIGGDLYDVQRVSDELIVFVIFDVAARGVSAALMAAMAKVSFANHVRLSASPRAVIARVNEEMTAYLTSPFFLTAFVGFLDLHDNRLTFCNAGHSAQVLFRGKEQVCETLSPSGTLMGVFNHEAYDERSVFLHQGDWLVLHTKGVYALFGGGSEKERRESFMSGIVDAIGKNSPPGFTGWIDCLLQAAHPGMESGDVAVIAVNAQTQSRRFQLKELLGFVVDDPVYLQHINYFEEMDAATAVILRSMDNQGYADDVIRKMKITLTELLVNALDHGNNRDPSKRVAIGHIVDNHKTVISIMDEGPGFEPAVVPDPTLPENLVKDSGRGLFIVRCYVDEVAFNDKANRITITKFFD